MTPRRFFQWVFVGAVSGALTGMTAVAWSQRRVRVGWMDRVLAEGEAIRLRHPETRLYLAGPVDVAPCRRVNRRPVSQTAR